MRSVTLFVATIVLLGLLVLKSDARSPRVCEKCKPESCATISCECGSYKDECNCCDVCMKCARESCSTLEGDVCQDGYVCGHPPGTSPVDKHNRPGTCLPYSEVPDDN
ncbi:8.6 kDa transglutaminase substrate [Parasteatoda tepidariorum]|uniref:8.6 kDa transglutaminase substrate n=1 Tax=Parasteatoda tepidariorum TaxID=114398 RepID=UPI001C722176|nr:8.6 kDa transglutaminase substrate [Parasteatoda tepidariorum]